MNMYMIGVRGPFRSRHTLSMCQEVLGSLTMISLAITTQFSEIIQSPCITKMNRDCDKGFGVMDICYGQCTAGRGVIMHGRIASTEVVEIHK